MISSDAPHPGACPTGCAAAGSRPPGPLPRELRDHVHQALRAVAGVCGDLGTIDRWGARIARSLGRGGRLLAAGNGGSAAHAQHLTSELVGRFRSERIGYSAIALHGDGSAVTAIVNDYGPEELFARQVRAHGRAGDVLVGFSTSGRSPNLVRAAEEAGRLGIELLAVTGPRPNPLAGIGRDPLAVDAPTTAAVQEAHQVLVHLLCVAFEHHVDRIRGLTVVPSPDGVA